MHRVQVYTTPSCSYCVRAKRLLEARGIPFAFITGYGSGQPDSRYPQAQVLLKPVDPKVLREVLGKRGPIGQVATA